MNVDSLATALRVCVAIIGLALLPAPVGAGTKGPDRMLSSQAEVRLLAAACSGCHRRVRTEASFPQIYGRPAVEIREALLAFKTGKREGTVMNRIAKGYSIDEIGLLADYFAAQSPANSTAEPTAKQ